MPKPRSCTIRNGIAGALTPALLAGLMCCATVAQAESLDESWPYTEPGPQLQQLLLPLAEDPAANRLLLGIELDQPCPATAAHCAPARASSAAQRLGVPGLQVEVLLRQLGTAQGEVTPQRLQQLGDGSGTTPGFHQDEARPIARL